MDIIGSRLVSFTFKLFHVTEFLRKRENILLEFEEKGVSYFPSPHMGLGPSRVEKD